MLERISGFTAEEAKAISSPQVESEVTHETALKIKEVESRMKEECEARAREVVAQAIQRCACRLRGRTDRPVWCPCPMTR